MPPRLVYKACKSHAANSPSLTSQGLSNVEETALKTNPPVVSVELLGTLTQTQNGFQLATKVGATWIEFSREMKKVEEESSVFHLLSHTDG